MAYRAFIFGLTCVAALGAGCSSSPEIGDEFSDTGETDTSSPSEETSADAGDDTSTEIDSSIVDSGPGADTTAEDSATPDTFVPDTFVADTFVPDTFVPDTLVADTFVPDTFVPDTAPVDTGPMCTSTQKICGGTCVSTSSTATGCADTTSCAPCPSTTNGFARCTGGACALGCNSGYHLCGSTCAAIGPTSCGDSCTVCPVPANSDATCFSSTCGSRCKTGFADCNGSLTDGCEKNLTNDPNNCGTCGHSCAGDACVAGLCQPKVLAVGQNNPSDLAVDATDLFWTNTGAGQVVKVAKVGGSSTIVASGQDSPLGIALDDSYVYWANHSSPGSVNRRLKSGSGLVEVVANSQYYAYRLFLSSTTVYYVGDSTTGYLRAVPKIGGLVIDMQTAESPKGLALDSTKLFWTAWNEIRKADAVALAPPTKLSNSEQFPSAMAMDDSFIYWTDRYANRVRRISKTATTSTTPTTLASMTSGAALGSIAVDDTHVYFIDPKANSIRKVDKTGASSAVKIADASDPRGLTIDANYVYWSNGGDGTVMRVAK